MTVEQLRLHEIAESDNTVLNPFTDDQVDLLGRLCRLRPGHRVLDLACGKGELLCRWARDHRISGVGVDLSEVFLDAARRRAAEFGVADRLELVQGDAAVYAAPPGHFDVVSCLGATWIGDGLAGTLRLMRPALREGGLMVVGEPFWNEEPPPQALTALGVADGEFTSLAGTAHRFAENGYALVEMVDHPDAARLRAFGEEERAGHLAYGRRYLGWGVFVLRPER